MQELEQLKLVKDNRGNEFYLSFKPTNTIVTESCLVEVGLVPIGDTSNPNVFSFGKPVLDYFNTFDVILYFYYDTIEDGINLSKHHQHLTPQEYRNQIFGSLIQRYSNLTEVSVTNIEILEVN